MIKKVKENVDTYKQELLITNNYIKNIGLNLNHLGYEYIKKNKFLKN